MPEENMSALTDHPSCVGSAGFDSPISNPLVCIIVPAFNEEAYIEACLTSLLQQTDCNILELIVVDGGSTDKTVEIVKFIMQQNSLVSLMHNPARIQSAAINLAAATANSRADVLVRADAHVVYAPDFIAQCVAALRRNGATSVVVPMRTVGKTGFQRAVAAVQNSKLGNGGALHRLPDQKSGFVDHGHHAAFDRWFFQKCRGYDESFSHNEDAELDHRVLQAAGRIWMCTEACVEYFPRATLGALILQYLRNGRGRARTIIKHGMRPKLRQLAPVFLLLIVVSGSCLSGLRWEFALLPLTYLIGCLLIGVVTAIRQHDPWMLAMGPAAIVMHLSYGSGFLQTLLSNAAKHLVAKTCHHGFPR